MLYLFCLPIIYTAIYLALFFGIPTFFNQPRQNIRSISITSIAITVFAYLIILFSVLSIADAYPAIANRTLHAVGGGVLAVVICFFATKDSRANVRPFQFFVMSVLVATLLGVGNEIAEYFLQNYFGVISAESINDTWLDLMSNTAGIVFAALLLSPFFRLYKRARNS